MKNEVAIWLGAEVPSTLLGTLERVPGLAVHPTTEAPYVRHGGHKWPVRLFPRPIAVSDMAAAADEIARQSTVNGADLVPLVLASFLPRQLRTALAARGISYADARGQVHLVAPGLFVHVDVHPAPQTSVADTSASGIGVVGIRAAQVLAADPQRNWSVAALAEEAQVSTGEAHKLLRILQVAGAVEAQGAGPRKRRRVRDLDALLDWLAAQPRSRRVSAQLVCSLYARTPPDLAAKASRALDKAGIAHAFTGGLAASLLGAGPTAVPRAALRVDPDVSLEDAALALGADVTERGANLVLWSDTGRVGTHGRVEHQGAWLAPPVRVYLDLLGERRGADAAAHFRDVVLKAQS